MKKLAKILAALFALLAMSLTMYFSGRAIYASFDPFLGGFVVLLGAVPLGIALGILVTEFLAALTTWLDM